MAADPRVPPARATLASVVAEKLRRRIVTGQLRPHEQLRVGELARGFESAISPVREALNRLSSEGLVEARDMRGFFVAPASLTELREITGARCQLNELALRQSIVRGDGDWENAVRSTYQRLVNAPRRSKSGVARKEWDEAHRAFHRALIAGCDNRLLVEFCDQLFVKADRYRYLARLSPQASTLKRDNEHRKIMQAALSREADLAVALLAHHFEATALLFEAACTTGGTQCICA